MITQDALARAIAYLGAIVVQPGINETIIGADGRGGDLRRVLRPTLYAFSAGRWHTATAATLLDFERYDTDGAFPSREDAALRYERDYPEAMAEMPSWWSPTQQFALCLGTAAQGRHACTKVEVEQALDGALCCPVVTVNLETGEEVSA